MLIRRGWLMIGVVALIVGAPIAWYLISPLFITRQVGEAFPAGEATEAMEQAAAEPTKMMEEPMPAGEAASPAVVVSGEFYPIAHEGRGLATIYLLPDGSRVLRFEDFEVLNGPDLHVWLVPIDPVPNTVGVEIEGYVELGALKGNVGNQNYDIPPGLDLTSYRSVVIWCLPFRVPFAAAPLGAP
ncbi:MAG: DM13 domain-containing protein [Anaerolineales bacterium]